MYAPHTVTLYNQYTSQNTMFEDVIENNATILKGVFYDAVKASNVNASGLEDADSVVLYIPFSVEAVDGYNGMKKTFASPKEYEELEDKSSAWTLTTGSKCFFVKGEKVASATSSFQEINKVYDSVHVVTKIDMKDFGSPNMQHWEVGGA